MTNVELAQVCEFKDHGRERGELIIAHTGGGGGGGGREEGWG